MTSRESIYIKNKYTKIYFQIINSAKSTNIIGYTEKHHIIPRSLGGTDDKSNLVKLTARQHYICHLLLTKMVHINTPEYHKMIKAYMMMANMKGDNQDRSYKVNSRLFDKLKVEFNKIQSIQQSGSNNSQYGTIWVYNPTTKENKKINKNDTIPDGWFKGKVDNWNTHFTQRKCKCCGNIGTMSVNSVYCSIECRISNIVMKKDTVVRQKNIKNDINKPLIDLINERSSYDGDCLIWNKSVTTHGLPQYVYQGKNIQVHKYMYEHHNKEIVDTKTYIVKQSCGNKKCINPLHLKCISKKESYDEHNETYTKSSKKQRKTWIINGVNYGTIRNAAKELGMSQATITKYMKNGIFDIEAYRDGCRKTNMKPKL